MQKYLTLALAVILFSGVLITCGNSDDRQRVRSQVGEPDRIVTRGSDPFWSETYFYDQLGTAYEFHRTAGCGSARDVFLYAQYYYTPIPADSTNAPKILPKSTMPTAPF